MHAETAWGGSFCQWRKERCADELRPPNGVITWTDNVRQSSKDTAGRSYVWALSPLMNDAPLGSQDETSAIQSLMKYPGATNPKRPVTGIHSPPHMGAGAEITTRI